MRLNENEDRWSGGKGEIAVDFFLTTVLGDAQEKLFGGIVETAAVIKLTKQRGRPDRDLLILSC